MGGGGWRGYVWGCGCEKGLYVGDGGVWVSGLVCKRGEDVLDWGMGVVWMLQYVKPF